MNQDPLSIDLRKMPKKPEPPVAMMAAPTPVSAPAPAKSIQNSIPSKVLPPQAPSLPPKPKSKFVKEWKRYAMYCGAVVVVGGGIFFFMHGGGAQKSAEVPAVQQETIDPTKLGEAEIIARVGKLILLPQGETPTLARVSDPSLLGDQPFFKNAKKDDIVLMYAASRRAVLYDAVENKIVEVAPIVAGTSTSP